MRTLAFAWFVAALWASNSLVGDLRARDRFGAVLSGIGAGSCLAFAVMTL